MSAGCTRNLKRNLDQKRPRDYATSIPVSFGQQLFMFGACFGAIPNVDDDEGGAAVEMEREGLTWRWGGALTLSV